MHICYLNLTAVNVFISSALEELSESTTKDIKPQEEVKQAPPPPPPPSPPAQLEKEEEEGMKSSSGKQIQIH